MSIVDKARGRTKESLGRVTGNRRLEREGKVDRSAGALKGVVDRLRDALTGRGRHHRDHR